MELPIRSELKIKEIVTKGKGLARDNGKVVFVDNAVPGDVVDVQITKEKKDYEEGRPIRFHEKSDLRVEPFCEHFGLCGGCKFQNISYEEQLRFKQKFVEEAFERIAKVEYPDLNPILPADQTRYFRNKMEFTFSQYGWKDTDSVRSGNFKQSDTQKVAGFHIPNQWDKVMDIEHCYLQDDPSNEIRLALRNYAKQKGYDFFNKVEQEGFIRTLTIRTTRYGETMAIVSFFQEEKQKREDILKHLADQFPDLTSLLYVINSKGNPTIDNLPIQKWKGRGYIIEEMEDLRFRIGPKSFFQTNTEQAQKLYQTAREFANLSGDEIVYDLYCGIGPIGLLFAPYCQKVVGIEQVPEAIEYAKINAEMNNLENTQFFAGLIQKTLTESLTAEHGNPDVIVTNPGRSGMHKRVVRKIKGIKPAKVVYISCKPSTQARDVNRMSNVFEVQKIQPVDMFPQTAHVENILLLTPRPEA